MPTTRPIALVDMDGTLCDFDGAMQRELEKLRSPDEDPRTDDNIFEDVPHIKARRRLIKSTPGFWLNLQELDTGFEILRMLQFFKFDIHILTHGPQAKTEDDVPWINSIAWKEKAEWCAQHVPGIPLTVTGDKTMAYGKVLVDDWPKYFRGWLEHRPRGLVIAPAHPWNETFDDANGKPTHPQVLRYKADKSQSSERSREIARRLDAIRATVED